MKIVRNQIDNSIDFSSVKVGDPFLYSDNLYIKVRLSSTEDAAQNRFNAIRLNDGYSGMFQSNTRVNAAPKAVIILEPDFDA